MPLLASSRAKPLSHVENNDEELYDIQGITSTSHSHIMRQRGYRFERDRYNRMAHEIKISKDD